MRCTLEEFPNSQDPETIGLKKERDNRTESFERKRGMMLIVFGSKTLG